MNESWHMGMGHFQKGNYYAARDLWRTASQQTESLLELARITNSLGAAEFQLTNFEEARNHFERANAYSLRSHPSDPLRIKYMTNLAQAQMQEGNHEAAVQTAYEAINLASDDQPMLAANAYIFCVNVFLQGELYREVIRLHDRWQKIEGWLSDGERSAKTAVFLHNLGYAAQAMRDYETALHFYQTGYDLNPSQETLRAIAGLHLLRGDASMALTYFQPLHNGIWDYILDGQKGELADSLVLVGILAYCAKETWLYERCTEKAELYYGQLSRWDEWLGMRDLGVQLSKNPLNIPKDALDWGQWTSVLDEFTLLDSMESLFPGILKLTRTATQFAAHLVREDGHITVHEKSRMVRAGRLRYLGLTAMCSTETEAREKLRSELVMQEMIELSVKLLDVYPHSHAYRSLIQRGKRWDREQMTDMDGWLAAVLEISFDYLERIEFSGMSHSHAVETILQNSGHRYPNAVIEKFSQYVSVGQDGQC